MNPATQFFADMGTGDLGKALANTTEDFTWTVSGKPGDGFALAGTYDRARYVEMLGHVSASMPAGPRVDVTSMTETPERIVIEARVQGVSADGVVYDNQLVYVFDLKGDKIKAAREYLDTIHAAKVFTR
jgi:ketosteroid isomerase-like protein